MSLLGTYLESLESKGRFFFTRAEAKESLQISNDALNVMIYRLMKDNAVLSLNQKCCLIVPIQYRTMGAPPVEWYLNEFMRSIKGDYYVGLLTAAAYHGSSHQAVQVYQVVTNKRIRPIKAGRTRLVFIYKNKKNFENIAPKLVPRTNEGVHLSSPELTAIDLLMYKDSVGSLNAIATVLAELADAINVEILTSILDKVPLVYAQRLGYIWELTEQSALADHVHTFLESKPLRYHPLEPKIPHKGEKNKKWHLIINTILEPDDI